MRILHVISGIDPRTGGPASALRGLASAQRSAGLEVSIVTTWCEAANMMPAEDLRSRGVPVHGIGPAKGKLLRHPDIANVLQQLVPAADCVHIHALFEEIQHQAARAARASRVPYVIRPCGMLDPWSLAQKPLRKRLYMAWRLRRNLRQAAAIHYTADLEAANARPLKIDTPTIIEPNGVEIEQFRELPPLGAFRAKYPELRDRPIVLFFSRLHKKKGLDVLIPAFATAGLGDAVLVLAGPDEEGYGTEVRRLVAEHHLEGRTLLTGMLHGRDRIAALVDADLFVLPSYTENFGIAVVEALAAGTPVIISDRVNIHREISDARVGGVVPLGAEALAKELVRWMSDAGLRRQAAERARAFVSDRYDWNAIAQRWAAHYERLIAPPGSSSRLSP